VDLLGAYRAAKRRTAPDLDHDDFGLNQSKIINVIYFYGLERVAGGKPLRTFP
jgi:polar amino acid transport system permease protein